MSQAARVRVVSRDRSQVVDSLYESSVVGTRCCVRTRSLERGELVLGASQEPVEYIARLYVVSCDSSPSVDAARISGLNPKIRLHLERSL